MIDKNEAPEGYEAVESGFPGQSCTACDLYGTKCAAIINCFCFPSGRDDRHYVIFKRKQEQESAIFPYGSCGEY